MYTYGVYTCIFSSSFQYWYTYRGTVQYISIPARGARPVVTWLKPGCL